MGGSTEESSQPSASSSDTSAASTYEVTFFWEQIQTEPFDLCNDVFDGSDFSLTTMAHILENTTQTERRVQDWEKKFISTLYKALNERGLLRAGRLPGIAFSGSQVRIHCPNSEVLMDTLKLLKTPTMTYPDFSIKLSAEGFPFKPKFWVFNELPADPNEEAFKSSLKRYLGKNEGCLGKVVSVWARFYEVSGVDVPRTFAGSFILLTDPAKAKDKFFVKPGLFQGQEPIKCAKPSLD